MEYQTIKVEDLFERQISQITLGPAPANIVSAQMMSEISQQLALDSKNKTKKLVILKGEGKHFSFGASVEEHKPGLVNDMLPGFHSLVGDIIKCDIPTLAMVSGMCLGGAFELALACSFIFADDTAKFGVPEIELGVFPPVACALLPLLTSNAITSEAILTGKQFKSKKLYKLGLINKVTEKEDLVKDVMVFIEKHILPKSASSLKITHTASRMIMAEQYERFIPQLEKLYLDDLMSTQDATEGIMAFIEKREPKWQH